MEPERDPRLYVGIRAQLASKIRDGEFPVGPKLPTEKELAGPVRLRDQRRPDGAPAARSGRTDWPGGLQEEVISPSAARRTASSYLCDPWHTRPGL